MKPQIRTIQEKKLIGICLSMSLANNGTAKLWGAFMPRRNEIKTRLNEDYFSLQVYPPSYFQSFNPEQEFVKWACVEVSDFTEIPDDMEAFTLTGGLYAVFNHTGASSDGSIFHYIYTEWLPNSGYQLDDRPHFEVLGEKYKKNDPDSEEEIWIPIRA